MIKFLELREKLKSNRYGGLCLFGNDEWVKRRALSNICEAYGIQDDGLSIDRLDSPTLEDLNLACLTPSMFCSQKLVVAENFALADKKDAQSEAKQKRSADKFADLKKGVSDLLDKFDGSFCLVFVSDTDKGFAEITNLERVDCNRLDRSNIVKWIVSFGKRQGVAIDTLCAGRIADYCLLDMARVSVETQKLIDHGEVTAEAVEMLVYKDAEYAVYDLSGAIADRNAQRAFSIYRGLIARGEENRSLFSLIYNFYRRVYYVKTSSFGNEELSYYLGVKAGAINFARETASRYKPMQLKRALDILSVADERLKAFVDETEVMNILIMQLISL